MLKRISLIIIALILTTSCATLQSPWQGAENKKSGVRFIPIELWTGEEWDGNMNLEMKPAHFKFGKRNHKLIKGPVQWRHPITGSNLMVYERINETIEGTKRQLFTLNSEKTGLAKVYDKRPGRKVRFQSDNAVLFPLGWWKKGERREYHFVEYVNGKKTKRKATIRMRRLSFTYKDVKHAMKFDWILTDLSGKVIFHERFIYGPGKSLMYFKNRLKTTAG